jgi:hypothetical protein
MQSNEYDDRMIEAFVDKAEVTTWYKNAFSKFDVNGVEKMTWVWSWWAFFGGIFYLLYRKAYLAAGGLFILTIVASIIPFGGIALWIATGGLAPYFVYKVYLEKKREIETRISDEEKRIETMRAVGGYHNWVIWVAVAIHAIFWIVVFSMLSSILTMLSQQ